MNILDVPLGVAESGYSFTTTIIGLVLTFLGGGGLLKLYQAWNKNSKDKDLKSDKTMLRTELKDRIAGLDTDVEKLREKIEELVGCVIELTANNSRLEAEKVSYTKLVADLRNLIDKLEKDIEALEVENTGLSNKLLNVEE